MLVRRARVFEQARKNIPQRKIDVTSKPPVGGISVVTLIRTDTTLDHSQKAEKVWRIHNSLSCHIFEQIEHVELLNLDKTANKQSSTQAIGTKCTQAENKLVVARKLTTS